ncbi:hypothetical protein LTR37_020863 [Vermiconidia calcicola]|uniref:Uncharacterized protein n=1 Tax=Vermiconidia calcicola TaxID=1690605 RepID=A0ACC3MA26_9PEZI|nr:hypothetical protein LTR37_020863 [Vermiconidia calcicola]
MPRSRRAKPELSASWDDVRDDSDEETFTDDHEDEQERNDRDNRHGRKRDMRSSRLDGANGDTPRKRATRSSLAEPDLVMPSSPNAMGNQKSRAKTPHFRMNERSMTSDAGSFDMGGKMAQRAKTPRFRMNARSMTSDAGSLLRRQATLVEEVGEGEDDTLAGYAKMAWRRIFHPILAYCADVVGLVLANAKPLIAYVLFAYLIGAALVFGTGFVTNSVNNALTPLCRIPGVTRFFDPPFCPMSTRPGGEVEGPAEFDKLVQAQSAFNDVLVASSTGQNLPLDMKKSEASIRDLKHVVEYSTLPSKHELVYEFGGFIDTAKQASQDLSKFNSRIGRAVDNILSTNRWTLNVIDGIATSEAHRGSLSKFFANNLNIFAPFQPVSLSRDVLLDQYLRHTSAVEEQILNLINEAQALLGILDNLDSRLDVIRDIATRDGIEANRSKDELFAYLWTKLGGNRSSVAKLNSQLQLLRNVGDYRRIAWAHVTNTIVKLQAIRDNLEDLRERVAMPETIGAEKVPLEVHIDAINLGIERLEEQRDSSRKLEAETYNRVLERAERGEGKMIGGREL